MYRQLNGTLQNDMKLYTQVDDREKQPAQPVKEYQYQNNNIDMYRNPPLPQQQDEESQQQTQEYKSQQYHGLSNLQTKKQRAHILRQRAGLGQNRQSHTKHTNRTQRKIWGNFLVVYDGSFTITLGPDYWCFIPTFLCFSMASAGVLYLLFTSTQSTILRLSGLGICLGELFSYLLIATSNPGIAKQQKDQFDMQKYQNPQQSQPMKGCRKCGFSVPRSSFHCKQCDLCILEYDHHCPWTSKCIGKNNLVRFYFFLIMTPVFLIFIAIAFVMVMSQADQSSRRHHVKANL